MLAFITKNNLKNRSSQQISTQQTPDTTMNANFSSFTANGQSFNNAYWPFRSNHALNDASTQKVTAQLNSWARTLMHQLTGSSEPRVWQTHDAYGQTLWNANDPTTSRTIRNASENEIRIWLEERYVA